jgi:hypothetical protein
VLLSGHGYNICSGQILNDSASVQLVKRCIDNIYNFRFSEANEILTGIKKTYPEHPVTYLINGMLTFWNNYPLTPASPNRQNYEEDLRRCITLCENYPDGKNDEEFLLANLCARGLLLLFYADNDLTKNVIPLAASTYKYLRRSFDFTNTHSDFYFFTGLYNYYREAYPEVHPIYKPLAAFFPKGDIENGLIELQTAANTSILLKAESSVFIFYIYQNFKQSFTDALTYIEILHNRYPLNEQYLADLIKCSLFVNNLNEAEALISSYSENTKGEYLTIQLTILQGVIQEKKYKNYRQAQEYYNEGLKKVEPFGAYADEIASVAYFGLSRIEGINGNKKEMEKLRKQGMDLTSLKSDPLAE